MNWIWVGLGVGAAGLSAAAPALAQSAPPLVAAYARQLAEQCGPLPPGATANGLIERVDLTADGVDDWVVDASRYPCPNRPAISAAAGSQVTVFRGIKDDVVAPVFQAAAFGARVRREAGKPPKLWVTLGRGGCGDDTTERCDRVVAWDGSRLGVTQPAPAPRASAN